MSKETATKNTRQAYLDGKCSHREYYGQFVNASVLAIVASHVGKDAILKSSDEHLNDIPLKRWDAVFHACPAWIAAAMREAGDFPTLAGMVCIAKEAANQIREAR